MPIHWEGKVLPAGKMIEKPPEFVETYISIQYTLAGFVRDVPFTLLHVFMQKKDA